MAEEVGNSKQWDVWKMTHFEEAEGLACALYTDKQWLWKGKWAESCLWAPNVSSDKKGSRSLETSSTSSPSFQHL